MTIFKAIVLTLLATIIYYIPQAILVLLVKNYDANLTLFYPYFVLLAVPSAIISYVLVFYYFWKPKPVYSDILDIKGLDTKLFSYLFIIAIGYVFFGQPFSDYNRLITYFESSDFEPVPRVFRAFSLSDFYRHISILIIAPIFEELFFRKFLFSKLLENYKLYVALIVSSVCFSAIHFETPDNLIPTFVFGLISALIYYKTKKISYSILLHFFANVFVSLINFYGETFLVWLNGLKFDFLYWALFIFGILLIVLGVKLIYAEVARDDQEYS